MKYNININQLALASKKLDLKDCAILDYLKAFCSADDKKIRQMTIKEEGIDYNYTWINFKHLIREMPLLGIKYKSSISERMKKIEKTGYIKTFLGPDQNFYVRLTEKIKEIDFTKGVHLNERGCSPNRTDPFSETNRYTNSTSIKHNINNTRLGNPTEKKRNDIKYPKSSFIEVEQAYKKYRQIEPQGQEWLPIQQAIKSMFMSGRTPADIIACMKWMAEDEFYQDKWTIKTIKLKLPEFLAGRMEEEVQIPSYAKRPK